MFLSARWHEDDVETAILVLRKNQVTKKQRMDSLYKVFRYDDGRLKPETIASLLGIHVDVKEADVTRPRTNSSLHSIYKTIEIIFVSVVISALVFIGALWYYKTGIFHLN